MELRRWEGMQTDCLVNIFSRLGLEDLITAVSFVCRSWNQASFDPLCQRILDFRHLDFNSSSPLALALSVPGLSFSGFFKLALERARGAAVDLRFPSHFSVSKQDLSLASDECPKLRNLILPRVESEDEEQLLKAISKWKELEVLEMDSKPSILAEMVKQISIHCNKFKGLKLRGSIKKEDAAAIVGCLPNLKWLDLSSCRLDRGELLAIVDGCRHLKRLSVRDCIGFEVDEEVKKRASGIELFEHEGSTIEDVCEVEDDGDKKWSFGEKEAKTVYLLGMQCNLKRRNKAKTEPNEAKWWSCEGWAPTAPKPVLMAPETTERRQNSAEKARDGLDAILGKFLEDSMYLDAF